MDKDYKELERILYCKVSDSKIAEEILSLLSKYVKEKVDDADFEGYKRGWEEGYSGCEFNRSSE